MKKIAVTGTIGSGKSECCRIIKDAGYSVFDCDEQVNKLYADDYEMLQSIVELFGDEIITTQGVNKKKIAQIIFSNNEFKKKLENIVIPKLRKKLEEAMRCCKNSHFFAEVPLLFENNWESLFDINLLIVSNNKVVLERLMNCRKYTLEEATKRINSQMSTEEKITRADVVIRNDQDFGNFEKQVKLWLQGLKEDN